MDVREFWRYRERIKATFDRCHHFLCYASRESLLMMIIFLFLTEELYFFIPACYAVYYTEALCRMHQPVQMLPPAHSQLAKLIYPYARPKYDRTAVSESCVP